MVEQLGLAMILSVLLRLCAFTSGTISFFDGSILQAEELSITVIPASANLGANKSEVFPPAENKAIAGLVAIASSAETTLYFLFLKVTSFPIDFSEATGINSVTGKFLSSSTCNILLPTSPLPPPIEIFIFLFFMLRCKESIKIYL